MIQALTFDFWNTLFVVIGANVERVRCIKQQLERAGYTQLSAVRIERAVSLVWREWDRVWEQEQRTFGASRWVSLLLADLGVSLAEPERERLVHAMTMSGVESNPPLVDGVAALLPRLAERYRLGLICDTGLAPGRVLRTHMESHGILNYFTHLTFSDELGVSKPHPRAFLSTLARLGVSPAAAVHVGDYPRTDIAGAQGVGMRAIRFTGVRDWPDGTIRADAEIQDYSQLEPLLERWKSPPGRA